MTVISVAEGNSGPLTENIELSGAFVIAFVIILFLVGLPLFYLEITLAQYSKKGPSDVFKSVPALRGKLNYSKILTL